MSPSGFVHIKVALPKRSTTTCGWGKKYPSVRGEIA
jgi:hypothetical protein